MTEIPLAPSYVIKPDGTKYRIAGDAGPEGPEGPQGPPGVATGTNIILSDVEPPQTEDWGYPWTPGQPWIDTSQSPASQHLFTYGWSATSESMATGTSWSKPASWAKAVYQPAVDGVLAVITSGSVLCEVTGKTYKVAMMFEKNGPATRYADVQIVGLGVATVPFVVIGYMALAADDVLKYYPVVYASDTAATWKLSYVYAMGIFLPWGAFNLLSGAT